MPPLFDEARLAIARFLARYSGPTRTAYATDLRQYFAWWAEQGLDVFGARRGHLELWARSMEERGLARATVGRRLSTVTGFYRFAVVDGLIPHSPAESIRRPKISTESATLRARPHGARSVHRLRGGGQPHRPRVACLLGLLGLRVSEACSIDIEDLGSERGHNIVTVLGKGAKLAVIPLPPRIARALDLAAGERRFGPFLLARSGDG